MPESRADGDFGHDSPHASLTLGQQRCTPAMAAGWTTHRRSMTEWLARPVYVA
jgi:hypothetical protein